jgi:hypothetical protein
MSEPPDKKGSNIVRDLAIFLLGISAGILLAILYLEASRLFEMWSVIGGQ